MNLSKAKIQKVRALRSSGMSIKTIIRTSFPYWADKSEKKASKAISKACRGIHYTPAWKRPFR
jgi:hypothetical protein